MLAAGGATPLQLTAARTSSKDQQQATMALLTSYHPTPVYLVDFSVYKPPEEYKLDRANAEIKGESWSVSV